jgi:hypothetical protein
MKSIIEPDKETSRRIDNYSKAIKSVGLKKLMNNLIDAGILKENYSYDTFKANYRRLTERQTGIFLKPKVQKSIFRFLDGFTYKDFFGESEEGGSGDNKDYAAMMTAISDLKTEMKTDISALKENSDKVPSKDYTYSKDLIQSAKIITGQIGWMMDNQNLPRDAFFFLFILITYPDKKVWKHGSTELSRIDKIFNQMTRCDGQIFNFDVFEGHSLPNFSDKNPEFLTMLTLGNFYLVIAYQVYLIKKLHKLYSNKNFQTKLETKNEVNLGVANAPKNIVTEITVTKVKIDKQYKGDVDCDTFSDCIRRFDVVFNSWLKKYHNLNLTTSFISENIIPSPEYNQGLSQIITFLYYLLFRFVEPKLAEPESKMIGWPMTKMPSPFELFKQSKEKNHKKNIETHEENYVVTLTDNDIVQFNECISFFKNLEYNSSNNEQVINKEDDSDGKIKKLSSTDVINGNPSKVNVRGDKKLNSDILDQTIAAILELNKKR